jgi:hypothetical protein
MVSGGAPSARGKRGDPDEPGVVEAGPGVTTVHTSTSRSSRLFRATAENAPPMPINITRGLFVNVVLDLVIGGSTHNARRNN